MIKPMGGPRLRRSSSRELRRKAAAGVSVFEALDNAGDLEALRFLAYRNGGALLGRGGLGARSRNRLKRESRRQTCILDAVIAFAVPAIVWIEESALILVLAAADFISWRALLGDLVTEGSLHEKL
jgi:hypothetical protein